MWGKLYRAQLNFQAARATLEIWASVLAEEEEERSVGLENLEVGVLLPQIKLTQLR
jgi:hypothetical protein